MTGKPLAPSLLTVLFLLPASSQAQQWSDEEQQVLEATRTCMELFAEEKLEEYLSVCTDDGYTRWSAGALMPIAANYERSVLAWWLSQNDWVAWDIQPHSIHIAGDAAVMHYQLAFSYKALDGGSGSKVVGRSDFLVRRAGAWKVLSIHEHEAPQP